YFDGKEGLYREMGRRWRAHEAEAMPDELPLAELIKRYVRESVDNFGGRLLAWDGLADTGDDDSEEAQERNARLRHEVEALRRRQEAGEIGARFGPAARPRLARSGAHALAVYPHSGRGLFGADPTSRELVERYAEQLALLISQNPGAAPAEKD